MRRLWFEQSADRKAVRASLGWAGPALRDLPLSRLVLATTLLMGLGALPVSAQRTTVFDLNQAICANDWDRAVGITGMLVADDNTTDVNRESLLALRRRLEYYRADGLILHNSQTCSLTDPYFLVEDSPTESVSEENAEAGLGWEMAVAEVTENQYASGLVTESPALTLPVNLGEYRGLTPAQPVDLSRGLNVVSGHVGAGHEVYGFVAGMGDRVNINLEVTEVMTGSLYTSDDSQLFVFDREGRLIASADDVSEDGGGNQSHLSGVLMPRTDVYFAVVTSYNNDPIFNQEGRLTGWQENGGGRFDYTLSISGATPTSALVR
ncbi:MAG: hypothetical protein AAF635_13255 [Cyanobacteria bacterium P01_C01_bin.69]